MARLRVLCTLALTGLVQAMEREFEATQIVRVEAEFLPTAVLLPRLRGGERADVVMLTRDGIEAALAEGLVQPGTERDLARAYVGAAVREGAPHPDISTPDAFVQTLLRAESIGMSRHGASGLFLAGLLERLGIAEQVSPKAVVIESGFTAELAASGQVELALQQVSELMQVPGVEIVGRIPPALGGETVFAGAVCDGSEQEEAGLALLEALAGAGPLLAARGLEGV